MDKRSLNMEVIEKLIEAKRLEKEAFLMLFPDHVKEHLNVIGKEIKTMLVECLMEESFDKTDGEKKENQKKNEEKVKKVDIG